MATRVHTIADIVTPCAVSLLGISLIFVFASSANAQVSGRSAPPSSSRAPQRLPARQRERILSVPRSTASDVPQPSPRPAPAKPMPLRASRRSKQPKKAADSFDKHRPLVTMGGSLALVIGVFLLVVWGIRRAHPGSSNRLPADVLEPLGRMPLAGRLSLQLVRIGNKLVLLSVSPDGAESLAEITDPQQVARLCGRCRGATDGGIQRSFQEVMQELAHGKRNS